MVSNELIGNVEPEWRTDGFGMRGEQVEPSDDDDLVWDTDVWTRLNPEQDSSIGPASTCPVTLHCDQISATCDKCGIQEYASPFEAFYKTMVVTLDIVYEQNIPFFSFRHEHLSSTTTFTYVADCPCPGFSTTCTGTFDFSDSGGPVCSSNITGCSGFFVGCTTPFIACAPPFDYWQHVATTHITGNPLPYYTFDSITCLPSNELKTGCTPDPHCTITGALTATSGTTATYSVHRHVEAPGDPTDYLDVVWDLAVALSDEDTTADLIARTIAALPAYDDDYNDSCFSQYDLRGFSFTVYRFKPKFVIPTSRDTNLDICYNEHYVPDGGDPVDTPKTVTILAGETFVIGDEVLEPAENGTITITGITCC